MAMRPSGADKRTNISCPRFAALLILNTRLMSHYQKQLTDFLSDMYSVEQQALAQLVSASKLAVDGGMATDFDLHYEETKMQAESIRERLEAQGGSVSAIKDAIMKLGGKGFLLFAQVMPETPGRLAAHAYAYEAMEWAGYEMLIRFARAAGDPATVAVAEKIRDEERGMMKRLERDFDGAEKASHANTPVNELGEHVRKHLIEAHALEAQAIKLLGKGKEIAADPKLGLVCELHLEEAHVHSGVIEARLAELGSGPSKIADSALGMGGLNWGLFFHAQSDTPAKLAAFVYAYEHLKIGGYELLRRTAARAKDSETEALCQRLLAEERAMADRLISSFDGAVQATLAAVQDTK
jgi:ferritin-like metal-binding protein YciE